jgi:DNA replication and repair protein RecF
MASALSAQVDAAARGPHDPRVLLRHLAVRDFRNLARVDLDVPPSGLALVGDNGHGKTNLLEAVYYLHLFRSLRGARDAELVRFGTAGFHLEARVAGPSPLNDSVVAGYERTSGRKKIVLDGAVSARISDALGAVPSVAFSPSDVAIVAGAPGLRRRMLDVALASTSRRYLQALQQYRTALAQRNAALRRGGADARAHAAAWEAPLAEHGAVLRIAREDWVVWARDRFSALGVTLGESERMSLRYRSLVERPEDNSETAFRDSLGAALVRSRDRDIERGATLAGPHRDDLDIRLGTAGLRRYGSAGQQRTAAIALRLLERSWYREQKGYEPVVLLDDPLAELDRQRAGRVLEVLTSEPGGQALLAVPRADDIPHAMRRLERFIVRRGEVLRESGLASGRERN